MKRLFAPAIVALALLASGCISLTSYVDPALGDVPATERASVQNPGPVQFIFEFKTQGAANARATRELSAQATEIVQSSGLFSQVSTAPVPGGALLSVTVDNIPQEGAAGRGFATGLTLGLAGSTVSDYYVGTARFSPATGAPIIVAEERHALHSTIGNAQAPQNLTPAASPIEGVRTMFRQLMDHLINDVAKNPGFTAASSTPPPAQNPPS